MTTIDAATTTGDLLFHLACDVADLMERLSRLEAYAGWPSHALRNELQTSLEARGIHPQLEGDKTA